MQAFLDTDQCRFMQGIRHPWSMREERKKAIGDGVDKGRA